MGPDRNLVVGLFVIAAIVIGISLTAWITGQRGSEPRQRFDVMINSDVSGLTLGGPVFFMGVQVGTVTNLAIEHGNPAVVRVGLNINRKTPIDTGTWATLAAQGITGVSVINLSASPGEHQPLTAAKGQDFPVIPYRDTGFSALLSSAPAVIEKLDALLNNANQLLGPDNQKSVMLSLENVQRLSDTLVNKADDFGAVPGALNRTLADIEQVTQQLNSILEEGGPSAARSLANLESATARLEDVSTRLDLWMNRYDSDVQSFSEDGLAQVPQLITDARNTMAELDRLLKSLRSDPSQAIYRPNRDEITVEE